MDIKIDSLISFDTLRTDLEHVFSVVEKNGKAVLLKDNKPVYVVLKYDDTQISELSDMPVKNVNLTLHEAMKIVLSDTEDKTMHASKLADIIYERRLYLQKNGGKAQYTQIRARCSHYPDLFEALPGNYIKLKEDLKQMNGEAIWNRIITGLSSPGEELQTTTGLWFKPSSNEGRLYVDRASNHTPSSEMSMQRTISKKDFLYVFSYYDRWFNGESGVRHEVSRKSRNTAYIFALIEKFK